MRWSPKRSSRSFTSSGSDEARTSKRRWTALETLLTFWPPAPCARTAVISISCSGMTGVARIPATLNRSSASRRDSRHMRCKLRAQPVAPALFRTVERLVGRADDLRRGLQPAGGRAGADRDGDREVLLRTTLAAPLAPVFDRFRPAGSAHRHAVILDRGAQLLEVRQHVLEP